MTLQVIPVTGIGEIRRAADLAQLICDAADLRGLHLHAQRQLALLLAYYGFDPAGPLCEAELQAWAVPPVYAATRDRSLLGSMNQFKDMAWHHFAYVDRSLPEAASRQWEGLFRHPDLARSRKRHDYSAWQRPVDLVSRRSLNERIRDDVLHEARIFYAAA